MTKENGHLDIARYPKRKFPMIKSPAPNLQIPTVTPH